VQWSAAYALEAAGLPLSPVPFPYPTALHVTMAFETRRAKRPAAGLELWPLKPPDVLKTARAIEDALTGALWTDDAQIVSEYLAKRYGPASRVVVVVTELLS
jgi:Holliday junction resolvase RusA-like endonuclease